MTVRQFTSLNVTSPDIARNHRRRYAYLVQRIDGGTVFVVSGDVPVPMSPFVPDFPSGTVKLLTNTSPGQPGQRPGTWTVFVTGSTAVTSVSDSLPTSPRPTTATPSSPWGVVFIRPHASATSLVKPRDGHGSPVDRCLACSVRDVGWACRVLAGWWRHVTGTDTPIRRV